MTPRTGTPSSPFPEPVFQRAEQPCEDRRPQLSGALAEPRPCTKLAEPGITTEPRGHTASQSRPADIFTTADVSGRSAALDVSVASSVAAAARGDAAGGI